MKKILMAVVICTVLTTSSCVGAEDRTFFYVGDKVAVRVKSLLVQHGRLKPTAYGCGGYCGIGDLIGGGGFDFITVGVNDPLLIKKIDKILQDEFDKDPKIRRIIYEAYEGRYGPGLANVNRKALIFKKQYSK